MGLMLRSRAAAGRRARGFGDRVTDARFGDLLDVGDDEADFAGRQFVNANGFGRQHTQLFDVVHLIVRPEPDPHAAW